MSLYRYQNNTDVVNEFYDHCNKTYPKTDSSDIYFPIRLDGVNLHIFEQNERLILMMELEEEARSEDISQAIPVARIWKERLTDWQGPSLSNDKTVFLEFLHEKHDPESGMSYNNLAQWINSYLASCVSRFCDYEIGLKEATSNGTIDEYLDWIYHSEDRRRPFPFGLSFAQDILGHLGIHEAEINTLLADAKGQYLAGKPPFTKGYPVSRSKVKRKPKGPFVTGP